MSTPATPRLTPRAEVERAKARLVSASHSHSESPAARLVRDHPLPALGIAAVLGFVVVVVKPGRLLVRQVLLAGSGIMLRWALAKYVRSS